MTTPYDAQRSVEVAEAEAPRDNLEDWLQDIRTDLTNDPTSWLAEASGADPQAEAGVSELPAQRQPEPEDLTPADEDGVGSLRGSDALQAGDVVSHTGEVVSLAEVTGTMVSVAWQSQEAPLIEPVSPAAPGAEPVPDSVPPSWEAPSQVWAGNTPHPWAEAYPSWVDSETGPGADRGSDPVQAVPPLPPLPPIQVETPAVLIEEPPVFVPEQPGFHSGAHHAYQPESQAEDEAELESASQQASTHVGRHRAD